MNADGQVSRVVDSCERMSFLAGRLAATEGAFFNQHSKQAAVALKQKLKTSTPPNSVSETSNSESVLKLSRADVLPEVLRHSLPIAPTTEALQAVDVASAPARSSLATSLKSILSPRPLSQDGAVRTGFPSIQVVDHFASVPQTSLGRKKWMIDAPDVQMVASTANESRVAKASVMDEKAAMEGLFVVTKAFAVATGLVFGGSIIAAAVTASKHDIKSFDDIRTKGRDYFTPRVERMKNTLEPLKSWANQKTEAWKIEEERRRAIGVDYAKSFGLQQTEAGKYKSR
ncbi:uncharacterized protein [Physcomitrium patens]|uniref:Uncharacterized protein n=1 Tax=Physcomitrium patens TaxID=3218 RepID=A0A2K1IK36_PHYPA|nr:uncharacterized protein LOC112275556 isoform X2 [Physcomitrium patens]XP_024361790.1 uncharacterized protein LOC112275556 isoform X2 [Physcomitrium patens]PNR29645.1 hypothetical protein PHYPA_028339 [Physcomitrium patens]|eukprot:XP_024361789.1 uncharacterized protein LOC112275556 isoform X2 [Physcomitrella patens]